MNRRATNLYLLWCGAFVLAPPLASALARDNRRGEIAPQTIIEALSRSRDHSVLVAGLKAAGLADLLGGSEAYTVFAPTNQAFAKLPAGAVDNLFKAENRPQLKTILGYHMVKGALRAKELAERIGSGGGKTEIDTLQGETLTIEKDGRTSKITDVKGNAAIVTNADVSESNGVIFVINGVLLP